MSTLIAHVAISVAREPVPVVVVAILGEIMQGHRAGPEIVIHSCGNLRHGSTADRVAPFVAKSAGHVDVADQAVMELLDPISNRGGEANLCAVLDDAGCSGAPQLQTVCLPINCRQQGFSTYTSLPAWHAQIPIKVCQ